VPSLARHEWAMKISEFVLGHELKPTAKFQHISLFGVATLALIPDWSFDVKTICQFLSQPASVHYEVGQKKFMSISEDSEVISSELKLMLIWCGFFIFTLSRLT
jgi:hypothetical protein